MDSERGLNMILDSFHLKNKVAIVTGCNTGLGQAMAIGLAEAGCKIVGVNRTPAIETAEQMHAGGHSFIDYRADLLKFANIDQFKSKITLKIKVIHPHLELFLHYSITQIGLNDIHIRCKYEDSI